MSGLPPFQIPDSVPSKGPGTDGIGKRPGPSNPQNPTGPGSHDADKERRKAPRGHKKDRHRS